MPARVEPTPAQRQEYIDAMNALSRDADDEYIIIYSKDRDAHTTVQQAVKLHHVRGAIQRKQYAMLNFAVQSKHLRQCENNRQTLMVDSAKNEVEFWSEIAKLNTNKAKKAHQNIIKADTEIIDLVMEDCPARLIINGTMYKGDTEILRQMGEETQANSNARNKYMKSAEDTRLIMTKTYDPNYGLTVKFGYLKHLASMNMDLARFMADERYIIMPFEDDTY